MPLSTQAFATTHIHSGMISCFRRALSASLSASLVSLGGCGTLIKQLDKQFAFGVGAEPLSLEGDWALDAKTNPASYIMPKSGELNYVKYAIGNVIYQSEAKCGEFLAGLTLHETSSQTIFDFGTTVFSALGAVFTPIATAHIFAAAASISSGTRTLVDQDVFAKASVANYAQAIQVTYFKAMQDYVGELGKSSSEGLIFPVELAKLQTIHATCSLSSAQFEISNLLKEAGNKPALAGTVTTIIALDGNAKAADLLRIVPQESAASLPLFTISVAAGESSTVIAGKLAAAIKQQPFASVDGITATASGGVVSVVSSAATDLKFTILTGKTGVTVSTGEQKAAAPVANLKATVAPAGQTDQVMTISRVPGRILSSPTN